MATSQLSRCTYGPSFFIYRRSIDQRTDSGFHLGFPYSCGVSSVVFSLAVFDFGSLFASIRHDGKSVGEIIEDSMDPEQKEAFHHFRTSGIDPGNRFLC